MFLTFGLVLDEGIEADENVEGSDKLEDDSFLHDTAEGKHEPDNEHHEYEDDDSQMFEDDSDIPLLQGVSSVIITYRTVLTVSVKWLLYLSMQLNSVQDAIRKFPE
jgi:hypothetical protein